MSLFIQFYRAVLKARTGDEWNRKPDVSYDVLNPEKPDQKRETKPYGATLQNNQVWENSRSRFCF